MVPRWFQDGSRMLSRMVPGWFPGWFQDGSWMVSGWFQDGFQDGSRMVLGWFQDGSRMAPGWFLFGKDKLLEDPRLYKGLDGLVTIPDLRMFLHAEISPRIE